MIWSCERVAESFGEAPGKRALKKNNNKHVLQVVPKTKIFFGNFFLFIKY
jgi:hypothetical protein